ncbi:hypothetical protein THMIRHAM_14560 [Thiomicrorhabdus immobilis]|uniref:DUF2066 domain-containing protein n=1 Tax=Thiomicrorhabdus immobilis TaxID=2791037 RepID=A0ABM7ME42_9GAMM|nr:DUF2066 domain-containing protein [Thiomicrorhabdus immobilis]BCN93671.1 hypothetical protein THMIRHAM_14560 [Thiomicrorhabdus immobilis]
MRSFQLLLVIMSLLLVQQVQSDDSIAMPESFFKVTLPYDALPDAPLSTVEKGGVSTSKAKDLLANQTQAAMQVLLLRLTGRNQLIRSKIGQDYIQHAKNWLASYYIKPRMEDGVTVGQNIELHFDAERLKKSFSEQHIKLWAVNQRPKTLVMGSFVQQGRLVKLNQEILDYRVDVDYRTYPQQFGLPIAIPEDRGQWVFPVEVSPGDSKVQEILIAANQHNLLSFKLVALGNSQYELTWYLFALNGSNIAQNKLTGSDRQALMQEMFVAVMQEYVKLSAVESIRKNHLYLNVHQLTYGDQVNQLEADLTAQQPMIRKVALVKLQADEVQFDIEYQGDYQAVLNWMKSWSKVSVVNALSNRQEIDVNALYQHFHPQFNNKSQSDSSAENPKVQ